MPDIVEQSQKEDRKNKFSWLSSSQKKKKKQRLYSERLTVATKKDKKHFVRECVQRNDFSLCVQQLLDKMMSD